MNYTSERPHFLNCFHYMLLSSVLLQLILCVGPVRWKERLIVREDTSLPDTVFHDIRWWCEISQSENIDTTEIGKWCKSDLGLLFC